MARLRRRPHLTLLNVALFQGGCIPTLVFLTLLAAFQPGPADPRIGNWTLLSAQSSLDPANRLSITPVPDGMHVVMSGETHFDFIASLNGHQSPAPGNLGFNQIQLRRISKQEAEVKEAKDGTVVATVREKLSKDAAELTSTTTTIGHAPQVTVWTRTGGAKIAKDPFAGEWTQDFSKTRLRQGLTLRIDSDSNGGVHFQGEYTYTARLDSKEADVKNSRNDTVALTRMDARTVDATYRRDNQVAQKDRWQVSADGQQMTLTSTATLATGQHVAEKLLFRKQ